MCIFPLVFNRPHWPYFASFARMKEEPVCSISSNRSLNCKRVPVEDCRREGFLGMKERWEIMVNDEKVSSVILFDFLPIYEEPNAQNHR
tara:strand:+ start:551 stop:817 length:267 start_codon:yes stop_codon:yes gene_type:complete